MIDEIYFLTTNQAKYRDLAKMFESLNLGLKQHNIELSELQLMQGEEIVKHKLQQAKRVLPNQRVIVDDRGFNIQALRGFPGPLVKPVLYSLGIEGLLQLMKDQADRRASFISAIGFYDGKKDHYFFDEEFGQVTTSPRGNNLHGWTELLYIFEPDAFPNKTLAELSSVEWERRVFAQTRNDCRKQLIKFLENR